jgi:MoaA/NifB/PqqE/SkfB family radical SAM enzyme
MRLYSLSNAGTQAFVSAHPAVKSTARHVKNELECLLHAAALLFPALIEPDPTEIYLSLTANCNLRCLGCRYGRDFMPGSQLSWDIVKGVLDDASAMNIHNVRFYGGEPLLHPDLSRMVEHANRLGLHSLLSTNGVLLEGKFDRLYAAGLRHIAIGIYGTEETYDHYVQRRNQYRQIVRGIAHARRHGGRDLILGLGWLLMRPTCNLDSLREVWELAKEFCAPICVSLIHYSLPYFSEGPDHNLQFTPADKPAIEEVVAELLRLKKLRPSLISQSESAIASIPDWVMLKSEMRIPCDRYKLIWVGADGTVQLCYVTFKLGNLHEKRLSEILFTPLHRQAARDAFQLKCPNCHCSFHRRVELHAVSRLRYSA